MSRRSDKPAPAGDATQDITDRIAEERARNAELKAERAGAAKEAKLKAELTRLERENAQMQAEATAEIGNISHGASLLYPDPSELPPGFADPSRVHYWANPEDEGAMAAMGYQKVEPPKVKQPDGTYSRHPHVIQGMVLWSTDRSNYDRRKQAERDRADTAARSAAEMRPEGIPQDVQVSSDNIQRGQRSYND